MALSNFTSAAAIAACLLVPCGAYAQAARPASSSAEEDIVVTATRFTESLKNVPVAVTLFNSADLERADVQDIRDIVKFTPGLANGGVAQGGVTRLAIRGIATQTGNGDDPISTYVDGIYLGKPISNALMNEIRAALHDLDQHDVVQRWGFAPTTGNGTLDLYIGSIKE